MEVHAPFEVYLCSLSLKEDKKAVNEKAAQRGDFCLSLRKKKNMIIELKYIFISLVFLEEMPVKYQDVVVECLITKKMFHFTKAN